MPSHPVLIQPSGLRFDADEDTPLLLAAQAGGIKLPSSCRNGTCRACMCLMLEGEIRYRIEWPGLSRDEKEEGWILPCVAHAVTALEIQSLQAAPLEPPAPAPERALTGARRRRMPAWRGPARAYAAGRPRQARSRPLSLFMSVHGRFAARVAHGRIHQQRQEDHAGRSNRTIAHAPAA